MENGRSMLKRKPASGTPSKHKRMQRGGHPERKPLARRLGVFSGFSKRRDSGAPSSGAVTQSQTHSSRKDIPVKPEDPRSKSKSIQISKIITGVKGWEEHVDPNTGHAFFFNPSSNLISWGLPLRDLVPEGDLDKVAPDDWNCHIQNETFRRFYESKELDKTTFNVPRKYEKYIKENPYFSTEFSAHTKEVRNYMTAFKSKITSVSVNRKVKLSQVLQDPISCAGFHRFLLSAHAEENLLFYSACEIFVKGSFQGQRLLGEKLVDGASRPGENLLYEQMRQTRATFRIGLSENSLKQTKLEQAKIIYQKFIMDGSELWIFTPHEIRREIEMAISEYQDLTKLQQNSPALLSIFDRAKQHVYDNMVDELFPAFTSAVIERIKNTPFQPDEVLRVALIKLLRESEMQTKEAEQKHNDLSARRMNHNQGKELSLSFDQY